MSWLIVRTDLIRTRPSDNLPCHGCCTIHVACYTIGQTAFRLTEEIFCTATGGWSHRRNLNATKSISIVFSLSNQINSIFGKFAGRIRLNRMNSLIESSLRVCDVSSMNKILYFWRLTIKMFLRLWWTSVSANTLDIDVLEFVMSKLWQSRSSFAPSGGVGIPFQLIDMHSTSNFSAWICFELFSINHCTQKQITARVSVVHSPHLLKSVSLIEIDESECNVPWKWALLQLNT